MSTVTVSKYGADLGDQLGSQTQAHVKSAAELVAEKFGITTMSGYRAGNSVDPTGHAAGLAIDIPATRSQGDAVAAFVTANAAALAVKYVIWQQRIWYPGKDWAQMATRTGSGDVNHLRHVHVSFTATGAAGGVLDRLRTGAGAVVGNVTGAIADLSPLGDWSTGAMAVGIKVAGVLAGLGLLLLGANRLVAPAMKSAVDSTLGAVT